MQKFINCMSTECDKTFINCMSTECDKTFINCMSTECDKTFISYIYFVAVQFMKVNSVRTL